MNKNLSVVSILQTSWADFKKWKFTLFALTSNFVVLFLLVTFLYFGLAILSNSYALFVSMSPVFFIGINFLYTIIVSKNVLDIVYNGQLLWFKLPAGIFKVYIAGLFIVPLSSVLSIEMNNSNVMIFILSWGLYFLIAYFCLRVSFVQQILLVQQGSITRAFNKSWNLTENRFCLLILSSLFQELLLLLPLLPFFNFSDCIFGFNFTLLLETNPIYAFLLFGCIVVVELYLILPLCLLMRSHLFKALVESENL